MKIDWNKPIKYERGFGVCPAKFLGSHDGHFAVLVGDVDCDHYVVDCHADGRERVVVHGNDYPPHVFNAPVTTVIWAWRTFTDGDPIVGWSWTEKTARSFCGNSLISIKEVKLVDGEGLTP